MHASDGSGGGRPRGGLGRGLSALLQTAATSLREVALEEIAPNPRQPRTEFDDEALDTLAASIRAVGVLQPVIVRPRAAGGYELVVGERRWRAARRAGLERIPAIVREAGDTEMLRDALIENLHREDLNPLEEAAAYRQLLDDIGLTHEELADRVGRSRAAITNALRLLGLAATVQRRIAAGTLTAAHGRAIAGLADHENQERAAQRVVAQNLSVRQTEDLVRRLVEGGAGLKTRAASSRVDRPPAILEVEKRLSDMLDTRVNVELGRRRGRLTIEFADLSDLDRIWHVIAREEA
ncbi:MAG: ParB/RepB/Spo0J family partition protein [Actinomycetota bacterium]